jgi:predicted membrane-bound spermidine synthase
MMPFAWWLSLSVGFLSLSQEILWVRLVSFAFQGIPHAFSFVLSNFLVGVALGALVGKWICGRSEDLYAIGAITLLFAAFVDLLLPSMAPYLFNREHSSLPWLPMAIVGTAALKSVLFPIAHHLGSNQSGPKVGSSVSRIYFGNIIGSALGPLVTGFYLLDRFTVEKCLVLMGLTCLVLSTATVLHSARRGARAVVVGLGTLAAGLVAVAPATDVVAHMAVRSPDRTAAIGHVIQNKHGIIHTLTDDKLGDVVYGGNVYDGRVSVDMQTDANGLERAYVLAALHPRPRRVLVIGMSTGAWTRVIAGFPGVEEIDVVEINPGYLELIKRYPQVSPLLTDARVAIHVDDGRRWLKRHPDAQYDLIVQNTTFHWRANSTNLLSIDYFRELRSHMAPGAIAAINTTSSLDVFRSTQEAFAFAFRFRNFVYAGDRDFRASSETVLERLRLCRIGDSPAFLPDQFEPGGRVYDLAREKLEPVADMLAQQDSPAGVVTDQNLLVEYRHGYALTFAPLRWLLPANPGADKATHRSPEGRSHD